MDILHIAAGSVPITQTVEYSCVLTNNWSGVNHPIGYESVSASAHWSPPILLAHSKFANLWSSGDMASPGIEAVAEIGSTFKLRSEIEILQTKGLAGHMVEGNNQFNAGDPPQLFESITLSPNHPYLSTISMMAPSPDWFSGLSSFCPRGPGGFWFESFEIATYPFDAGTETGDAYSINNVSESPHDPITPLTKDTVPVSGILLDPTGKEVLPVMFWKCTLKTTSGIMEEINSTPSGEGFGMSTMIKESGMMKEQDPNGGFRGLRGKD